LGGLSLARVSGGASQSAPVMFRSDPGHSGVYASNGASRYAGVQWRFRTNGTIHSSPAVAGGRVYVGSGDGYLYAIGSRDGAQRWRFRAGSAVDSSPAVIANVVYAQSVNGTFFAVDAATGKQRWARPARRFLPAEFAHDNYSQWSSSANLSGRDVVYGSADGSLRSVDRRSGVERWRVQTGGRIEATPAVARSTVYVGSTDGIFYAADAETGRVKWTYATTGSGQHSKDCHFDCHSIRSSPAVSENVVVFGARDGFLYALDADTGALRWRVDHQTAWINPSPAIRDGMAFDGTSVNQMIEAIDIRSGAVAWQFKGDGLMFASPALSGSVLYETDFAGTLFALDAGSGHQLWKYRNTGSIMSASPVVAGDRLYVGSDDGSVYALNLTAGPALQRAVFWDRRYAATASFTQSGSGVSADAVRDYLVQRGYELLDEAALARFLEARVADAAPSVVVFAIDYLPDAVAPNAAEAGVFRRYLDRGGKVVWFGVPPLLLHRTIATGVPDRTDLPGAQRLLGVTFPGALTEPIGAAVTADGLAWGLTGSQIIRQEADPRTVTTVLARDEHGLPGAWVRRFSGPPGTGFVALPALGFDSVPDRAGPVDLGAIQLAAEYYPR
jgi:outer membrane protein assembly factor BamB